MLDQGAVYSGQDFRGVDFRGKRLVGKDFTGSDLTGANLSGCDCSYAIFNSAKLDNILADAANFTGASMLGTSAIKGRFPRADFQGVKFFDFNHEGADLTDAKHANRLIINQTKVTAFVSDQELVHRFKEGMEKTPPVLAPHEAMHLETSVSGKWQNRESQLRQQHAEGKENHLNP